MTRKRILMLGGAPGYSGCAKAVGEAGYDLIVVDRNSDAFCKQYADHFYPVDFSDLEATLEVARKAGVHAVIPMNDFGVPTAAYVAEQLGLIGITRKTAAIAVSKSLMRLCWEKTETPSVRYRVARSLKEAYNAADELGFWPLIMKPCNSSGGGSRGVSRIDRMGDIEEAYDFAGSSYQDGEVILEEYIEGTEHSVEVVFSQGEGVVASVGDNIKLNPPFRVNKEIRYPSALNERDYQRVCTTAIRAALDVGIQVGAVHVEVCLTEDGPKLFELGARCGGGGIPEPIVSHVTGKSYFRRVVESYLGIPFDEPFEQIRGCVYRFLCPSPGVVRNITGVDEVSEWDGILKCGLMIKAGHCMGEIRTGLDRGGYLIAAGRNLKSAMDLADLAEKRIVFEYEGDE